MPTERVLDLAEQLRDMVYFYSDPSLHQIKDFVEGGSRRTVSATLTQNSLIFHKIGKITLTDKKLLKAYKKKERLIEKAKSEYVEAERSHCKNSEYIKPFAVLLRIKDLSDSLFKKHQPSLTDTLSCIQKKKRAEDERLHLTKTKWKNTYNISIRTLQQKISAKIAGEKLSLKTITVGVVGCP